MMSPRIRLGFRQQRVARGLLLLEALIAIVIFAIGVLSLVGLQAVALKQTADTQFRNEAANAAQDLLGKLWMDRTNLASYAHQPSGTACNFSGTASAATQVTAWVSRLTSGSNALPGITASKLQVIITPNVTDGSTDVMIRVCWRPPGESVDRSYFLASSII
jgi:type IV pilus assembly protein PilV